MKKSWMMKMINFWPPFLGAGIRVEKISGDFRQLKVSMKLKFWNSNYVGTHFGGSMFSMTDPFYVIMLIENLGRDYIVWDKSSSIRYKKPGKGKISATFHLQQNDIEKIKSEVEEKGKTEPVFQVLLTDEVGDVVAEVAKTLHVKRKAERITT